jgi:hypothetical protein
MLHHHLKRSRAQEEARVDGRRLWYGMLEALVSMGSDYHIVQI